jgi:dihydroneopterin aldolase
MDLIRIRGLEIDCIVGVWPSEREREQRVHIDLALGLDLAPSGRTGRIALTCNYAEVAEEAIALLKFRRYQLIEMATEELAAMLLGVHRVIEFVDIRLDKPGALDGRARAASVEVKRARDAFPSESTRTTYGSTETLLETREAVLTLHSIDSGKGATFPARDDAEWLEWLVAGDLVRDGTSMERHSPHVGGSAGEPSAYENVHGETAVLFRCVYRA